jgi:hypothetical protein
MALPKFRDRPTHTTVNHRPGISTARNMTLTTSAVMLDGWREGRNEHQPGRTILSTGLTVHGKKKFLRGGSGFSLSSNPHPSSDPASPFYLKPTHASKDC